MRRPRKLVISLIVLTALCLTMSIILVSVIITNRNSDIQAIKPNRSFELSFIKDESGMAAKTVNSNYTGVTKVQILGDNLGVISLSGVDGIGSNPICSQSAMFKDTDPEYISGMSDYLKNLDNNLEVIDLTESVYTQANLFGREIRIVNNKIYVNRVDSGTNFNPECGFSSDFVNFPELGFKITHPESTLEYSEHRYKMEYNLAELSESEIKELANFLSTGTSIENNSQEVVSFPFLSGILDNSVEQTNSFPLSSGNLLNSYTHSNYLIEKSIPVQMVFVSSKSFTSQADLYERFYMSSSPTGNFIKSYKYSDDEITLDMALIEPSVGNKSYMLIGSAIRNSYGFYFQIYLGDVLGKNLTESEINEVVKFNSVHNSKKVLDLIKYLYKVNLPDEYFKNFITTTDQKFEELPKGNLDLPAAQNRD